MSSVTQRIKEVKQPRGGYIKPSQLELTIIEDGKELSENENIHASVVGMAVDYLTRFAIGASVEDAFFISQLGVYAAAASGMMHDAMRIADKLFSNITGIDEKSVISACKLTTFDVWYRNPMAAIMAKPAAEINPDRDTVRNIQTMVERSVTFFKIYGPIIKDGFKFGERGYTKTVSDGDGDFLTKDTLWDFKVSKSKPTNKHTLQLLMYWIMGQHSGKPEFKNINNVGIFNPRLNAVYTLPVSKVDPEIIKTVEKEVICY